MIDRGGPGDIELEPSKALEGTRHLVLFDISKRLLMIEQEVEFCDVECDRALAEVWRLLQWIEKRLSRNGAFADRMN